MFPVDPRRWSGYGTSPRTLKSALAVPSVHPPTIRWILKRVEYEIRPARPADADHMHRVHTASVRALCAAAYQPAIIDDWLRGRSAAGYMGGISEGMSAVAESRVRVVGFCEAAPGEVLGVFVVPECAGHGVGAALLRHAVALAGGPGTPVRLEATLNAVGFYERFGFRAVRRAVVRRNDIEIPVVIMESTMVDIAIRAATIADSDRIARLVSDLGYRTSPSQMHRRLESILGDDDYHTLVACDGDQIVGFVGARVGPLYETDAPYGQIMALAVARDRQRAGVGQLLVRAAESIVTQRGARVLVVTSGNHRADAHAFYEKNGYTFSGRRYTKASSS